MAACDFINFEIDRLNKLNIYPNFAYLKQDSNLKNISVSCLSTDLKGMIDNKGKTYSHARGKFKAGQNKLAIEKCDCHGNSTPNTPIREAHFKCIVGVIKA